MKHFSLRFACTLVIAYIFSAFKIYFKTATPFYFLLVTL